MTRRITVWVGLTALVLAWGTAGCGGAQKPGGPGTDRLAPTTLYPLAEGNVWSYNVYGADEDLPTLEVRRVISVDGPKVAVESWGGERMELEVRDQGIFRPPFGAWLLEAPIRPGAEWPSASGRTARVTSVDERVDVPAGHFEGCVRVEEHGGEAKLAVVTIYCPEVGPVFVRSGMQADLTGQTAEVVGKLLGYELKGASSTAPAPAEAP